jgi:tetratricopeptide (TPR) repeat protein
MSACRNILALAAALALAAGAPLAAPAEGPSAGLVLTTDQAIAEFEAKVKDNPTSPLLHTLLAQMYVRKARATGDLTLYDRAEASVKRALELDKTNVSARILRAQVLCAGHRFAEGLALARDVYKQGPGEHGILYLIGDAHLELGDYAEAEQAYGRLRRKDPTAYLGSRLARLAELKGRTDEALRLLKQAAAEEGPAALSPEDRAWYDVRLAEVHLGSGHLDESVRHYQAALKTAPRYYAALAGLARARTAQGKFVEAIALYRQAVAVTATLPMLAELGDLYARSGKDFLAKVNHDKLEQTARGRPAYNRELALFWCDHDRELPRALELARAELKVRKDVHTYDALAWALCKNGRLKEARAAMAEALKLGTKDASFYYHAGVIHHRLGETGKARQCLKQALALNPHFSLRGGDDALRLLAALDGKPAAPR